MKAKWLSYWNRCAELPSAIEATGRRISEEQFELIVENIKSTLEVSTGDRVVEIGCGNGLMASEIAKSCSFIVGTDFSNELCRNAIDEHKLSNMEYIRLVAN
jgi:cyclopropane fatty-acyl-phospholipid synthase-like methyltransferase